MVETFVHDFKGLRTREQEQFGHDLLRQVFAQARTKARFTGKIAVDGHFRVAFRELLAQSTNPKQAIANVVSFGDMSQYWGKFSTRACGDHKTDDIRKDDTQLRLIPFYGLETRNLPVPYGALPPL